MTPFSKTTSIHNTEFTHSPLNKSNSLRYGVSKITQDIFVIPEEQADNK